MAEKKWVMPERLERFRGLIVNTGGNSIEELMNDHKSNVFNNAPRALICVSVKSQIALLEKITHPNDLGVPKGVLDAIEEICDDMEAMLGCGDTEDGIAFDENNKKRISLIKKSLFNGKK